ncbi:hypothetical protein GCM10010234_67370 [Streptomyces hawaiiensis]
MGDRDKDSEILAPRRQITVLEHQLIQDKGRFAPSGRALVAALLTCSRAMCCQECGYWFAPKPCWAGTATSSRVAMPPPLGQNARDGRGRCAPSAYSSCAWRGRIPAGGAGACTANYPSWA